MTEETLKEVWAILRTIDIKLTPQEKAVATFLLKARASRHAAKAAEKTVEKMNHKPLKEKKEAAK